MDVLVRIGMIELSLEFFTGLRIRKVKEASLGFWDEKKWLARLVWRKIFYCHAVYLDTSKFRLQTAIIYVSCLSRLLRPRCYFESETNVESWTSWINVIENAISLVWWAANKALHRKLVFHLISKRSRSVVDDYWPPKPHLEYHEEKVRKNDDDAWPLPEDVIWPAKDIIGILSL